MAAGIFMVGFFVALALYQLISFKKTVQPRAPTTPRPPKRGRSRTWQGKQIDKEGKKIQSGGGDVDLPTLNKKKKQKESEEDDGQSKPKPKKKEKKPPDTGLVGEPKEPHPPHDGPPPPPPSLRRQKHEWNFEIESDESDMATKLPTVNADNSRVRSKTKDTTRVPWSTRFAYLPVRPKQTLWRPADKPIGRRRRYGSNEEYDEVTNRPTTLHNLHRNAFRKDFETETLSWKTWEPAHKKNNQWREAFPEYGN